MQGEENKPTISELAAIAVLIVKALLTIAKPADCAQ
jgi:hypothetical protein